MNGTSTEAKDPHGQPRPKMKKWIIFMLYTHTHTQYISIHIYSLYEDTGLFAGNNNSNNNGLNIPTDRGEMFPITWMKMSLCKPKVWM